MIGIKIGDEFLDLPPDVTFGLEIYNSLVQEDFTPGMLSYPVMALPSPKNQRLLGWPGLLNKPGGTTAAIPCGLYLFNTLYKPGLLKVGRSNAKGTSINFQSDAGDISTGKDIPLQDIDLGTDVLSFQTTNIYPDANFVLAPVKNSAFYDSKNADFAGYLNYYDGGFQVNTGLNQYAIVPFPFFSYIFRKVMAHFGYTVTEGWLDSEEIRRVIIYNNYALDLRAETGLNDYQTAIDFRNHVPDIKVGEFLRAVKSFFCLGYIFDPIAKTLEIVPRGNVLADLGYTDITPRIEKAYETEPNTSDGFTLEMQMDAGDELTKPEIITWPKYKVGNGAETIATGAGTLEMYRGTDALKPYRSWLVPEAKQKGSSPEFGLGTNKFTLRLLNYHGMQPDSLGGRYPLASWDTINYSGSKVGTLALRWEGPKGLYQQCWKSWLTWRTTTIPIDRGIRLDLVDLKTMDMKRKLLMGGPEGTVKALFERYSLTISNKDGIKTAKGQFLKVDL